MNCAEAGQGKASIKSESMKEEGKDHKMNPAGGVSISSKWKLRGRRVKVEETQTGLWKPRGLTGSSEGRRAQSREGSNRGRGVSILINRELPA